MKKNLVLIISSIVVLVLILVITILFKIDWIFVIGLSELSIVIICLRKSKTSKITISKKTLAKKYEKAILSDHYVLFIELSNLTTYSQYYDITLSDQILKDVYYRLRKKLGNKVYIYGTNQIIIINMFVNKTVINKTLRYQEQLDFSSSVKSFIEKWHAIRQSMEHRPYHPNSEAHQHFLKDLLHKLEELKEFVTVEEEIKTIQSQLNTNV